MAKHTEAHEEIATLADLLERAELVEREVDVPRWGRVVVRELSALEQIQIRRDATKAGEVDGLELVKRVVQAALVRPAVSLKDVEALFTKSATPINALYEEIEKLNRANAEGVAEAEAEFQD